MRGGIHIADIKISINYRNIFKNNLIGGISL